MPALLELSPLLIALWCLAYAAIITVLVIGLFRLLEGPLGRVPYVGDFLRGAAKSVAAHLSSIVGRAEGAVDSLVGAMFHALAAQWNFFWSEFKKHARLLGLLSPLVAEIAAIVRLLRHHVADIQKGLNDLPGNIGHRLRDLERGIDRIRDRIKSLDRRITHNVLPRLRTVEGEIGHLEDVVIPNVRGIATGAETDLGRLRDWITKNIPLPGTLAFAGAVAVALGRLGLGGLRCSSLTNSLDRRGCGLWSGLDDLLGLFIDVAIFTNACAVVEFLSPIVSTVAAPVVSALSSVGAGLCAGTIGPPAELSVPALSLPASPSDTLYLP